MSSVLYAGPGDPGDLFALLYDRWEAIADVNRVDEWRDIHYDDISVLADELRTSGLVPPWLAPEAPDPEHLFIALAAIDEALGDCHPRRGTSDTKGLTVFAARLQAIGSFSSLDVPGAVLPRWGRPARAGSATDRIEDAFSNLVRVPERSWKRLTPIRVPSSLDLSAEVGTSVQPLRVAFAPLLEQLEDVRIETATGLPGLPDANWYVLRPERSRLEGRIAGLLAELDATNAQIALLPEGSLDPDLLRLWQEILRSTRRPDGCPLRWLLLGTGPFETEADPRPTNLGVLVHRDTGEVLMEHAKFAPFNLGGGQPERWGLEGLISVSPPVHEGIYRGTTGEFLESRVGRVEILICEDVTRHGDALSDAMIAAGPSHILVPVFARVTRRWFWEEQAARRHSTLFGATVAVGNSLVVPDAESRGDPTRQTDSYPFCLLATPTDDPADPTQAQIGALSGGRHCCVLPDEAVSNLS